MRIYYSPADDGAGGGAGAGAGNGAAAAPPAMTAEHAEKLLEAIGQLNGGVKQLLTDAAKARTAPPVAEPEEDGGEDNVIDEASLEALPRKQFMAFMLDSFEKRLQPMLKPLSDKADAAGNAAVQTRLEGQVKDFAEKTADFVDWAPEMQKIAEESPGLSIQRIYAIAKAENPDKVKTLAEAAKAAKAAAGEDEPGTTAPPRRRSRGADGLTPGGSGGTAPNQRMTPQQAAESAWDDAISKFGNPFS